MLREIMLSQYHQLNVLSLSILGVCLVLCSISDIRTWTIPNWVTYPAYLLITGIGLAVNPLVGLFQILQSLIIFLLLFVLSRQSKTGFGMGDAKLMSVQAAGLPIFAWLLAQILALLASLAFFALKAIYAKAVAPSTRIKELARAIRIPLAPFLFLGTALCLIALAIIKSFPVFG